MLALGGIDRSRIDARHPELCLSMDAWLERRGFSWRQLVANDVPGLTMPPGMQCDGQVEALQVRLMLSDPVLLAETQFVERKESQRGSTRWRLFDYQKPSLRKRANFIYKCGAGVGKTRQIVILIFHGLIARRGLTLVVGNQESTVHEILEEVNFILERNPFLRQLIPKVEIKLKPHPRIRARNGNSALLVPTGNQGKTLRGKHVTAYLLGDECAVWYHPWIWRNFWRCQEQGCETRLFSVPDGRTDTDFYRIAEAAVDFETAGDTVLTGKQEFFRVRWQKPDMPPPFWTEEIRRKLIAQYGGEDDPGYLQNVFGLDGDPENAVFPKVRLDACVSAYTPYTMISVAVDPEETQVRARTYAANPSYYPGSDEQPLFELDDSTHTCAAEEPEAFDDIDADPWAAGPSLFSLTDYLEQHLKLRPGSKVFGADYGYQTDPSEFLIFDLDDADVLTLEARIHLRRVTIDDQEALVRWLLEHLEPEHGMGGDGFGYGQTIDQGLPRVLRRQYTPVNFQAREGLLDEKGRPVLGDDKKPRLGTVKAIAVQQLERRVQRRSIRLPYDPALRQQFENYVARRTKNGRTFNPKHRPDHIIDAAQAAVMRLYRVRRGQIEPPPLTSITTVPRRRALDIADPLGLGAPVVTRQGSKKKSARDSAVTVVRRRRGSSFL